MGYTNDLTPHVETDCRLLVMYHLDEHWKNAVMKRALETIDVEHTIEPEDVIWAQNDDGDYFVNYRCENTKQNESVAQSLPMILVNTNIIGSMTMTESDTMVAMLVDSGCTKSEIRNVLGIEELDNEEVEVSNYETEV